MYSSVKFGELYLIDSKNGLTKPRRIRGSGYKMINMGELFDNDRIYDIPMELVPLSDSEKINAKVETNDLLFARQSLVLEGAGKCSIVLGVSPLTVFESHIIRVRLNPNKANPLFYFYYFNSPVSPIKTIVNQCAQAGIRGSDLENLKVLYPPKEKQDEIAFQLDLFDKLIENYKKQIILLEESTRLLYIEWFVKLNFPGHEKTEINNGIPLGWEERKCSDLFNFVRGKSYKSEEISDEKGVIFVNLKNINAYGGYKRNSEKRFIGSFSEEQELSPGDIVMSITDMTQERRLVGYVALIPNFKEKITFSMDLIKIIPINVSKLYLYSSFLYGGYSKAISAYANGVNVLHLRPETIKDIKILIPERKLQDKYSEIIELHLKKIENLQSTCYLLESAKKKLISKLLSKASQF